jgi:hypothetical protein
VTAQVRLYRVKDGMFDTFVTAWRDGIVPLRRQAGYTVDGAWGSREEGTFTWVVAYVGPLSWEEAERRYYAMPERSSLEPDPASFLDDIQTWLMDPVPPGGP